MHPSVEYAEKGYGPQYPLPVLLICALLISANTVRADVLVFTDRHHPVEASAEVSIITLDAPAEIEVQLAADLPADSTQAAIIVQQRLEDSDLQRRLSDAYQGVVDAWSLGVNKIPAVVVDRRYVVYGESNVPRALANIEKYRRK